MKDLQDKVEGFHRVFKQEIQRRPIVPSDAVIKLREELIQEEFNELKEAHSHKYLPDIMDAIGDLIYVLVGEAVSCGVDLKPILDAIHVANMKKAGGHLREDGKWIKPDDHKDPDIEGILQKQIEDIG